ILTLTYTLIDNWCKGFQLKITHIISNGRRLMKALSCISYSNHLIGLYLQQDATKILNNNTLDIF
ncbi:hypothetical protein, partial [Neobacillus drentensis]|uniref:hypothetical protein n=1 Tax=Neobacillus drentensis TaxID=220684 RepID=UPI002FFD6C8A